MLDRLYKYYFSRTDKTTLLDSTYSPSNAIAQRRHFNKNADKLIVIFPGWHGGNSFLDKKLIKRLSKRGWATLDYKFHKQIIEADEKMVVESFVQIQKQVAAELKELVNKHGYKSVHLLGMSLGNVALMMVGEKFSEFNGATLVVAGDDLAMSLWTGLLTQRFKDGFRKEGLSAKELDTDWQTLAPKNHVNVLGGKPVSMYLALKDKIINSEYQKRMARLVTSVSSDVDIKSVRSGHAGTITWFCLFGRLP